MFSKLKTVYFFHKHNVFLPIPYTGSGRWGNHAPFPHLPDPVPPLPEIWKGNPGYSMWCCLSVWSAYTFVCIGKWLPHSNENCTGSPSYVCGPSMNCPLCNAFQVCLCSLPWFSGKHTGRFIRKLIVSNVEVLLLYYNSSWDMYAPWKLCSYWLFYI